MHCPQHVSQSAGRLGAAGSIAQALSCFASGTPRRARLGKPLGPFRGLIPEPGPARPRWTLSSHLAAGHLQPFSCPAALLRRALVSFLASRGAVDPTTVVTFALRALTGWGPSPGGSESVFCYSGGGVRGNANLSQSLPCMWGLTISGCGDSSLGPTHGGAGRSHPDPSGTGSCWAPCPPRPCWWRVTHCPFVLRFPCQPVAAAAVSRPFSGLP